MKRAARALLLAAIIAVFSASCAGKISANELAQRIRKSYTEADAVSLNAEVTANYAARSYKFVLKYVGTAEGGTVTILEPENVSGITAKIGTDGVTLSYDGAEVFTGEVTAEGLGPVDALPVLVGAWRSGTVTEASRETVDGADCLRILYRITDEVTLSTLFDAETYFPVSAELVRDGYTVLTAAFLNVEM